MSSTSASWADIIRQSVDINLQAIRKINYQVRLVPMQPASHLQLAVTPR